MTDIVERLRPEKLHRVLTNDDRCEAADEIERLRAQCDSYASMNVRIGDENDKLKAFKAAFRAHFVPRP